jgi:hypothetical protein
VPGAEPHLLPGRELGGAVEVAVEVGQHRDHLAARSGSWHPVVERPVRLDVADAAAQRGGGVTERCDLGRDLLDQ